MSECYMSHLRQVHSRACVLLVLCRTISTLVCMHLCMIHAPSLSYPPPPLLLLSYMHKQIIRHRIVHRCHCWCCDRVSSSECNDIHSWLWSWSDSNTCLPEDIQTDNKYVFLFVNKCLHTCHITSSFTTESSESAEDKVTSSTPGYMNVELEDKSVPMTDNPSYEHVQRTQLTKPLYGNL